MARKAIITGVRGQDGSYLAEYLLSEGYQVFGFAPHRNGVDMSNLEKCLEDANFTLVNADMTDSASIQRAIGSIRPDEIYNLAAQSFVGKSWELPAYTANVNFLGLVHIIEAILSHRLRNVRVYQASTSEMFGKSAAPQSEATPFDPCSPYGIAKLAAHRIAGNYRESYGMFICCGILFNHESTRRPECFLTQKVAKAAAMCAKGFLKSVELGNLTPKRDWGWAPDYVVAMHRMLQLSEPDDFVLGTGESHTVREFAELAFETAGIDFDDHHTISAKLYRPVEVPELRADIAKAEQILGWSPQTKFHDIVIRMTQHWLGKVGVLTCGENSKS